MKRLFSFMLAMLLVAGGMHAATVETTLWTGEYSDNIAIPAARLEAGGTVTVYVTATQGASLHLFYIQNNPGWTQQAFTDNGGTIGPWPWVGQGTASYQFTIAAADMAILKNNTEETGSRGHLMIGTADAEKVTITKVTLTTSHEEAETGVTTVWSGSHDLASWSGLALTGTEQRDVLKNAKKGDVIRITYTADEAGQINVCDNKWSGIEGGHYDVAVIAEAAAVDFEIRTAAVLENVQNGGIVLNGTNALVSKVELLTFASSYDAVPLTIGDSGIATWSSMKKCDFSGTGLTAYYVSDVAVGSVTLKQTATTWDWCGYIVVGDAGTYDIPVTESASYPSATYLKAKVGAGTVKASESEDEKFRYILAIKNGEDDSMAFYKLTSDHNLGAHKAYLETDSDIAPAAGGEARGISLIFEDEATGIRSVEPLRHKDEAVYTLSGVRVQRPARGLYITGGRKVFVK